MTTTSPLPYLGFPMKCASFEMARMLWTAKLGILINTKLLYRQTPWAMQTNKREKSMKEASFGSGGHSITSMMSNSLFLPTLVGYHERHPWFQGSPGTCWMRLDKTKEVVPSGPEMDFLWCDGLECPSQQRASLLSGMLKWMRTRKPFFGLETFFSSELLGWGNPLGSLWASLNIKSDSKGLDSLVAHWVTCFLDLVSNHMI